MEEQLFHKNWQTKTLLIAEDQDSNFKYLEIALRQTHINIIRALNGREAITLCKDHTEIDLVLMDIKMPTVDGLEAVKEIRKFNKNLPIIALTAYAMADDREKSLQAGCNDYVPKPVTREHLFTVLTSYLGE